MVTKELREGYGRDPQFVTYGGIYQYGGYEKEYGPLWGAAVTLIKKPNLRTKGGKKTIDPGRDVERERGLIRDADIRDHWENLVVPTADLIVRGMFAEKKGDGGPDMWPEDRRQCVGRWGLCDYFYACDAQKIRHGSLRVDESRILSVDSVVEKVSKVAAGKMGVGTDGLLKKRAAKLLAEWIDKAMRKGPDEEAWPGSSDLVIDLEDIMNVAGSEKKAVAQFAPVFTKLFKKDKETGIESPLTGLNLDLGQGVVLEFDGLGAGPKLIRQQKPLIRIGSRQVAEAIAHRLYRM